MTVTAHIRAPHRGVNASFTVTDVTSVALLGPNGSGKSTILGALAGTIDAPGSEATINGQSITSMPARERSMALVTQHDDLFPSLSVVDNVAFGLRSRGVSRADARERALRLLTEAGLGSLAGRRPTTLSGGQSRRVAIVRALATQPRALLLDEPFAGIDVEAVAAIRDVVRVASQTTTTVIATHDAADAWALADHVVTLDNGEVSDSGPIHDVLTRPVSDFAARMAGRVLLHGRVRDGALVTEDGHVIRAHTGSLRDGDKALVAVAPRHVTLREVETGDETSIADSVARLEHHGDVVRVWGHVLAADVAPEEAVSLVVGAPVRFTPTTVPTMYPPRAL